jgi:hypothetical protein
MKAWKIKIIYVLGHGSLDADYKGLWLGRIYRHG